MTLRTIQTDFAEQLLQDAKEELFFDLRVDGPLFTKVHPKVIWVRLQQHYASETLPTTPLEIPGWSYDCFPTIQDAQKKYPAITVGIKGRPSDLFQFVESGHSEGVIDFSPVGAIVLSKNKLKSEFQNVAHWHELPLWFNYALSPELWGPQGKLTRFHAQLSKLFSDHKLLKKSDAPGFYVLNEKAQLIEKHGFQGTKQEGSYILSLPWTFPLSGLNKLEKIIQQEF